MRNCWRKRGEKYKRTKGTKEMRERRELNENRGEWGGNTKTGEGRRAWRKKGIRWEEMGWIRGFCFVQTASKRESVCTCVCDKSVCMQSTSERKDQDRHGVYQHCMAASMTMNTHTYTQSHSAETNNRKLQRPVYEVWNCKQNRHNDTPSKGGGEVSELDTCRDAHMDRQTPAPLNKQCSFTYKVHTHKSTNAIWLCA